MDVAVEKRSRSSSASDVDGLAVLASGQMLSLGGSFRDLLAPSALPVSSRRGSMVVGGSAGGAGGAGSPADGLGVGAGSGGAGGGPPTARRTVQRRHTETYGDGGMWGSQPRPRLSRTFSIGGETDSGAPAPQSTIVEDEVGEIEAEVDLEDSDGPSGFDDLPGLHVVDGSQPLPLPSSHFGSLPDVGGQDAELELIERELDRLEALPETPEVKARMQEIFIRLEHSLERELEELGSVAEEKEGSVSGTSEDTDAAIAAAVAQDLVEGDDPSGDAIQRTVLRRASLVMVGQLRKNEELFGPGGVSPAGGRGQRAVSLSSGWDAIVR